MLETDGAVIKGRYLRRSNLICQIIDLSLAFYLFNVHGDVTRRVDTAGNTLAKYDYDAFGNRRWEPDADSIATDGLETDPNPFRYCGEYWDVDIKEVYLRARTYNPGTGRFTSSDLARSGLNWYTYCANNPIELTDPTGLAPVGITLDGTGPILRSNSSSYNDYLKQNYYGESTRTGAGTFSSNSGLVGSSGGGDSGGRPKIDIKKVTDAIPKYNDIMMENTAVMDNGSFAGPANGSAAGPDMIPFLTSLGLMAPFIEFLVREWENGEIRYAEKAEILEPILDDVYSSTAKGISDIVEAALSIVVVDEINKDGKTKKPGNLPYNDQSTVREILTYKKGRIKNAPLPPGGPGWDAMNPMTLEMIRQFANNGSRYYKEVIKLLTNNRFNK